jgi:putative hemolysin
MDEVMSSLWGLLAVFALVFANGFFVAAEFSLVSIRRSRLNELAAQGNSLARTVLHVVEDPDRFIAATQLGITIASLGLGWIGEPALAHLIEPLFAFLPNLWANVATHSIAVGVAFAIITFMHVVLGELAPKSVALQYPETTAFFVARPTIWTENIFRPFIWLLNGAGNLILRLVGLQRPTGHQLAHSVEELKILVRASQESGILEEQEGKMAMRVFEFSDRAVREVMIPRTDVVAVERTATVQELLELFTRNPHSRFPVYEEDLDHVVGILMMKDVLTALADQGPAVRPRTLEEAKLIRPAFFVPESRRVGDLLPEMRAQKVHMAIVLDEYGGTAGLVTIEELIEEVVGRVSDEWVAESLPIKPLGEGAWEVDALVRVDEVNAELQLGLPEHEEYETVAGFLLWLLGRVPQQGEEVHWEGLRFQVLEMKGPKIERVSIARETQAV